MSSRVVSVLAALVLAAGAAPSVLACVVGLGISASCTEAALDNCMPGFLGFDGTITFDCGTAPVTITVTANKDITADTTIEGATDVNGNNLITISGGGTVSDLFFMTAPFTIEHLNVADSIGDAAIFSSNVAASLTVTDSVLSNNTIAIDTFGTKTVTGSTFTQNKSGGIVGGGNITVTGSTFTQNAPAINTGGTLMATGSTFVSNTGSNGGAIESGGPLTVTNCTFYNNNAPGNGGAILSSGTATVSNSTFVSNTAGSNRAGGAIDKSGSTGLTIINCTFSDNGAGTGGTLAGGAAGAITVENSILANPTTGGVCGGPITDGGHNIDSDATCGFTGTGCTTTTGTSFCTTNPQLDAFGDHGGPTQTYAILSGSPAVNAGDETVCAGSPVNNLDQRGFVRPGGTATRCSIGAYELDAALCGDINGDGAVNIGDALTAAQYVVGLRTCGQAPLGHPASCDVNGDGACNVGDALRMAQCDVGLVSCAFTCLPFPCP